MNEVNRMRMLALRFENCLLARCRRALYWTSDVVVAIDPESLR